jgi:hypothetical protein
MTLRTTIQKLFMALPFLDRMTVVAGACDDPHAPTGTRRWRTPNFGSFFLN